MTEFEIEYKPNLHNVKRVNDVAPHVGAFYATNGAWNRKYRAISVENYPVPAGLCKDYVRGYAVDLQFIGYYYADGKVKYPCRFSVRTMHVYLRPDGTYARDGNAVMVVSK